MQLIYLIENETCVLRNKDKKEVLFLKEVYDLISILI